MNNIMSAFVIILNMKAPYEEVIMKKIVSAVMICALTALLIIPQTGCLGKTDKVTKESFYFDTTCQITVYNMKDMSEDNANNAIDKAFKQCAKYEELLSKTKTGSDIYKINHGQSQLLFLGAGLVIVTFDLTEDLGHFLWQHHGF